MIKADFELQKLCGTNLQNRLMQMVEKCFEFFVESCRVYIRSTIHLFLSDNVSDEFSTSRFSLLIELQKICDLMIKIFGKLTFVNFFR